MDDKPQKNERQSHHSEEEQQQPLEVLQETQVSQVSEFIEDYQKEFDSVSSLWSLAQIQNKLLKTGRIYKKEFSTMDVTETILSTDFQSISLQLHYGFYAIKVNVINVLFDSLFLDQFAIGEGQFGTVYQCHYKEADLAIKVAKLDGGQQSLVGAIKKIYKEYFIAVLANQLQIGAKIIDIFGYNLVFMKNKAFFCMEKCQQSSTAFLRQGTTNIENLKTGLYMLHSMHLVHRDIKPTNVCWSPNFKKYVFIDFGLSNILRQTQGQKSYTKFVGTYAFCTREMQKVFSLKESGYIDLYYNDIHGLRKTLENLRLTNDINRFSLEFEAQNQISKQKNQKVGDQSVLVDFIKITKIKLKFFTNQFGNIIEQIENQPKLYKSCLEMMSKCADSGLVPSKILQKWRNLIGKTQQKIKSQNCKTSNSDQRIFRYLKMLNSKNLINQLIPLQYVFQNQINDFEQIFNDKQWIQRIFVTINPKFAYYLQNRTKDTKVQETAHYVVNKIYKTFNKTDTKIFIKKIRFVLLFLSQKIIQQKNVNIIQPLSDLFVLLGDYISSQRVKTSLLQIIDGSLVFYLNSLKFYLQAQPSTYFALPTSETQYLDNILNSLSNNKNKIQVQDQLLKIQIIGKQFESLLSEKPSSKSALQTYTKIYNEIQSLKQKLGSSDFGRVISQIQDLFSQMYMRLLENLLVFHYKTAIELNVQQLLENQRQKMQKKRQELQRIQIVNLNYLYENITTYFQRQYIIIEPVYFNQVIQLYFQIIEGRSELLNTHVWETILGSIRQNTAYVSNVLQLKFKWLQKRDMDQKSKYSTLIMQLRSIIQLAIQIYLNYSNSNLKQQQRANCCSTIQKIVAYIRKIIEQKIKNELHLILLNRFMSILEGLEVFSKQIQSESIKTLQSMYEQAINKSIQKDNLMEGTVSRISMINVFVRVRRQKLITSYHGIAFLQKCMINLWQFTDFVIGGLTSRYLLSQIVQLYNKNQRYEDNYLLFLNIFSVMSNNQSIYKASNLINLREGFCEFVESSPAEVQALFTKLFINKYLVEEGVNNLSKESIYLLFLMLSKGQNHIQFAIVRKALIIIANKMEQLDPCIYKTIKSKFYGIYLKKSKFCNRKGLILQRIESRQNCQRDDKKHTKLTKMMRQKVGKIYRNSVKQRMQSKLNMLIS